jgi:hypothetical protein
MRTLNRNPLHLVEAHLVVPAIVKMRCAGPDGFAMAAASSSVPPCQVIADHGLDAGGGGCAGEDHEAADL